MTFLPAGIHELDGADLVGVRTELFEAFDAVGDSPLLWQSRSVWQPCNETFCLVLHNI